VVLLMARIRERDKRCGTESALKANVHHLFLVRNMFFLYGVVLAPFHHSLSLVVPFDFGSGPFWISYLAR
jgi:hypothetical protein